MTQPARELGHVTARQYYAMAECGIISPDERVELLDGLIVSMPPQSPWHAASTSRILAVLHNRFGTDVCIRIQSSFRVDESCVPEPDLAFVPGRAEDYFAEHPVSAHLIVEVANRTLIQDRITKAAIYARAGVPTYWLVNLREMCVEVFRGPNRRRSEYANVERCTGSARCMIDAFPHVRIEAAELLPPPDAPVSGRDD